MCVCVCMIATHTTLLRSKWNVFLPSLPPQKLGTRTDYSTPSLHVPHHFSLPKIISSSLPFHHCKYIHTRNRSLLKFASETYTSAYLCKLPNVAGASCYYWVHCRHWQTLQTLGSLQSLGSLSLLGSLWTLWRLQTLRSLGTLGSLLMATVFADRAISAR